MQVVLHLQSWFLNYRHDYEIQNANGVQILDMTELKPDSLPFIDADDFANRARVRR